MWAETVAANRRAQARAVEMMDGRVMGMGCGHGAIWLVYAELQLGQDPLNDIDRCRETALSPGNLAKADTVIGDPEGNVNSWADMVVRRGIELGKWSQSTKLPEGRFMYGHFILDYGRLLESKGDAAAAAAALAEMKADRAAIAAALPKEFPDEDQLLPWIDRAVAQGEAIADLAAGNRSKGLAELRAAAQAEQALPIIFGPPMLQALSWELLGQELLADGRKAEAVAAFRSALAMAPGRRIATAGLKAATGS